MNIQKQNEITVENFIKDLRAYGRNVAKELVKTGGEVLQKRYDSLIDRFYNEYTPLVYKRWGDLKDAAYYEYDNKSSMGQYIDSRYRGSLVLDSNEMVNRPGRHMALTVSLKGIHGKMAINDANNIEAYDMIEDLNLARDSYVRHINKFSAKCILDAQTKYTYNIIRFK